MPIRKIKGSASSRIGKKRGREGEYTKKRSEVNRCIGIENSWAKESVSLGLGKCFTELHIYRVGLEMDNPIMG